LAGREIQDVFVDVIERAKALDPENARTWFDGLNIHKFDNGLLQINCPDEMKLRFLQDKCSTSFTRAAQQITGHLVGVEFCVRPAEQPSKRFSPGRICPALHPDYTFENFVVGPSNRLAHASCVAVSQSLGNTYNPLFIYGNSGLGKTHLLHAVCYEILGGDGELVVKLLSCEQFVNGFIQAIQDGNLVGFQKQFRTVDALVIDDVQFLSEREQSQQEFFHTFNALYNNQKQIILSCDCPPAQIPSLEDRLISRFSWGLVTRIDPPSYETRVAIVKEKALLKGLDITDEIAEYIGRKVHANIRELEGALTSIYAVMTTTSEPITLALAKKALNGQLESAARNITITDIIEVVTAHFDVRLADLQSKRRSQSITLPRQICMYLARNLTRHSLEEIGGHLGGRDHTTVMHACSKINNARKQDPQMHALLSQFTTQIAQTSSL